MEIYELNGSDFMSNNYFLIIIALVLLLQLRERHVRWWSLMIMPLFMLLVTASVVYTELSSGPLNLLLIAVGFAIGIAVGIVIGSRMDVKVDERGRMVLKGSTVAVLIWAAVIVLKIYGKSLLGDFGLIDIGVLTSIFLAMTLGTMISRRAYVYWQYRLKKQASVQAPQNE